MAEEVSALSGWMHFRAKKCAPDDIVDRHGTGKTLSRSFSTNEDPSGGARRPSFVEVSSERFTDFLGEWEPMVASTFAPYRELPSIPVNVV